MGFIWTVLYAITPVIGYYTITVLGAGVEMDGLYGLMIPLIEIHPIAIITAILFVPFFLF